MIEKHEAAAVFFFGVVGVFVIVAVHWGVGGERHPDRRPIPRCECGR